MLSGYEGRLLSVVAIGSFLAFLGRATIPPLLPAIIGDLMITASEAGLALSLLWFAYAIAHYPGGRLSDGLTRTTILVGSIVVMIIGFGLLLFPPSFVMFLVGLTLIGLGHGAYQPSARGLVGDLYISRRGQAIGVLMAASAAGASLSAGLAVVAQELSRWQMSFVPILGALGILVVAVNKMNRESYRWSWVEMETRQTITRILTSRRLVLVLIAYILFAFTWQGSISFLPTYIHQGKGYSFALGSTAYGIMYGMGIVVSPIAGQIGDRFSRIGISMVMVVLSITGLGLLILSETLFTMILGVGILATGFWGFPPSVQAVLLTEFPTGNMGGDWGAFKAIYTGLGAIGPAYIGYVAHWETYTLAYLGFIPCLLLSLLVLVYVSRK